MTPIEQAQGQGQGPDREANTIPVPVPVPVPAQGTQASARFINYDGAVANPTKIDDGASVANHTPATNNLSNPHLP